MFGEDIFQALYLLVVSAVCIIGFSYLHYAKKQEMLRLYRRYGMKMKEVLKLSSFHIFIVVTAPTLLGMWTRWHFYEWVSSVNQSDYMQKQSIVGIAMTGIIVLGLMAISILISSWLICRNLKLDLKIIGEDLE